jgi:nucleotide sugar dehydrogenase
MNALVETENPLLKALGGVVHIGIIGNGFVGRATRQLACSRIRVSVYDIDPSLCIPPGMTLHTICDCDVIFVSVPTPMREDGSCCIDIVESVVGDIMRYNSDAMVVLRSTVPPGTSDRLNCFFMPEFLTERNCEHDFISNPNWILGLKDENTTQNRVFMNVMTRMIRNAHLGNRIDYNRITFVTNKEAEMIKYFRNTFLSVKVAYCNEVYDLCTAKGINYHKVREIATMDRRIGSSHSYVPGPDGKRGFGGTCFPKDCHSFVHEMQDAGLTSHVVAGAIHRNETLDRPEKDWTNDKGRAVL